MKAFHIILVVMAIPVFLVCCKKDENLPDMKISSVEIIVGPEGGIFQIDHNMSITIPQDALLSSSRISVARLKRIHWEQVYREYKETKIEDFGAFSILPNTLHFNKPVVIHFSNIISDPGSIPILNKVNLRRKTHSLIQSLVEIDHSEGCLQVIIDTGGEYVVEANSVVSNHLKKKATQSCKQGFIRVETHESEVSCIAQDCQILESMVSVQFLNCPGEPIEKVTVREAIGDCEANIDFPGVINKMSPNSSKPVQVSVKVGCMGMKDQNVILSASGVGSINPDYAVTNSNGIGLTTVSSSSSEGIIKVTGKSNVRYPVREFIYNGEVIDGLYRREEVEHSIDIEVKEDDPLLLQNWQGTIRMSLADHFDDPTRNVMKMEILIDLQFTADLNIENAAFFENPNIKGTAKARVSAKPEAGKPYTIKSGNNICNVTPYWDNLSTNDLDLKITGVALKKASLQFGFTHPDAVLFFGPTIVSADNCWVDCDDYKNCREEDYTFNVGYTQTSKYRSFFILGGGFSFWSYPELPQCIDESGTVELGNLSHISGTYTMTLCRTDPD